MKIVTVEYRRLRTFGSYQNETVGAVAEVGNEDPADVLATLRLWVDERLGSDEKRSNLREAINELEWRHGNLTDRIEMAERKWAAILAFMAKLGIERPDEIPDSLDSLPF